MVEKKMFFRQHMRNIHNSSIGPEEVPQHHNNTVASSSDPSAVSSPTKYAQYVNTNDYFKIIRYVGIFTLLRSRPHKCSQCSKRYKTTQGLQNHVSQAHQKLNGSHFYFCMNIVNSLGTGIADSNAPSPAALAQLILQKTQGQTQQISAEVIFSK